VVILVPNAMPNLVFSIRTFGQSNKMTCIKLQDDRHVGVRLAIDGHNHTTKVQRIFLKTKLMFATLYQILACSLAMSKVGKVASIMVVAHEKIFQMFGQNYIGYLIYPANLIA
jgi:hypothetical protein